MTEPVPPSVSTAPRDDKLYRGLLLVASVLLVYPDKYFDAVGFGLVVIVLASQWLRKPSIPTS